MRLDGFKLAVSPFAETVVDRLIVPEKPARLLTVMMVVAGLPACTVTVLALDDTVKSPTPMVIVVVWLRGPLVAVRVTVYVPCVDELKVHVELAAPPDVNGKADGAHETFRPVEGLTDSVSETLPAKPPRLVRVTVEDPLPPDWNATLAGFDVIE